MHSATNLQSRDKSRLNSTDFNYTTTVIFILLQTAVFSSF